MRASDADREVAVERLASHHAAGRLDADELEERTAAVLRSSTVDELEALQLDLPPIPATPSRSAPRLPPLGRFRLYIPVIALLVVIWAVTGADYFWPIWPAVGWGAAIVGPTRCSRHRRRAARTI